MAVSKRLRYEILRRDGYACRYCGVRAPQAPLTIDHVVPRTLGGSDLPDNLAAACFDCNAGKSSSKPDDSLVAQVTESERDWQSAARPYREAVLHTFGSLPDFESSAERERLAARFQALHGDDEDPAGKRIEYRWPDDLKAFAVAVESLAERDWAARNTIHTTLHALAPGRVDDLIRRARQEFLDHDYGDFHEDELERYALHLAVQDMEAR